MARITFEEVVRYAELCEFPHREDKSHSKDYSQYYLQNPWSGESFMVLYETNKRIPRGKTQPQVSWVCINCYGDVFYMTSGNIRKCYQMCGFGFTDAAFDKIKKKLNGYE